MLACNVGGVAEHTDNGGIILNNGGKRRMVNNDNVNVMFNDDTNSVHNAMCHSVVTQDDVLHDTIATDGAHGRAPRYRKRVHKDSGFHYNTDSPRAKVYVNSNQSNKSNLTRAQARSITQTDGAILIDNVQNACDLAGANPSGAGAGDATGAAAAAAAAAAGDVNIVPITDITPTTPTAHGTAQTPTMLTAGSSAAEFDLHENDDYDGMQYNVECTHNRYNVLKHDYLLRQETHSPHTHATCDMQETRETSRSHRGWDTGGTLSGQGTWGSHNTHTRGATPPLPQRTTHRHRQTGRPVHGHRKSTSGDQKIGKAWAPGDTTLRSQERGVYALDHESGGRSVINATLSWSTPKGKIVSQALGDLNSTPIIINKHACRAMIDTGAGVNCIRKNLISKLTMSDRIGKALPMTLKDAQGKRMKVYGGLWVPMCIGDTQLTVYCMVVDTIPLPVILGTPFLHQTGARMDFDHNTMTLKHCSASVIMTPIVNNTISFHSVEDVVLEPTSETLVPCRAKIGASHVHRHKPKVDCSILEVQKSDILFATKSLIVKPTTVYKTSGDTYYLSIINPLSKYCKINTGEPLTDGTVKTCKLLEPSTELPDNIMLEPGNVLEKPMPTSRERAELDKACNTEWNFIAPEKNNEQDTKHIAGIRILWPEQPYCPPVDIAEQDNKKRTVGCQVEVDVGNQTRIQTFKPLDWDELLVLEPQAEKYRHKLQAILERHRPAFAADMNELAIMEGVYYRVDLIADAHPVNIRAYRMSPAHEEELDRQIKKLLDASVIQESNGSLWGAPAFVVFKDDKEGNPIKPRLVIDFYHTNKMLVGVKSPIPKVDDIIDHIAAGKNKVFSVVDLASAFYAIQLTSDSREICAINTKSKKYCFNRIPMGAKASPETFSSLMSRCLSPLDNRKILNYIDDLLIMTDTVEEHLEVLEQLFWRLRQAGLRISPTKVNFLQKSVKFLGYIFDENGVRADPEKMQALVKLPPPKDVKGVRTIMGCMNYWRRFVKDFSKIALPINELLRKDEPFLWDQRRQEALDTLKAALLKNAVLYSPDPNKPFIVCLDASDKAIGSVISQKTEDGLERPCVLMSKSLNTCQEKYHSNDKEALALVESLKLCEVLMGPNPAVEVYSDNLTTVYLNSLADKSGRLFRYKMYLNKFDIKVQHKQGKLNCVADLMSRLCYEGQPKADPEEEPDKHALISTAHSPFDEILAGQHMGSRRVCAVQDTGGFPGVEARTQTVDPQRENRPQPRGFCMFDRFEDHNFGPDKRRTDRHPNKASKNTTESDMQKHTQYQGGRQHTRELDPRRQKTMNTKNTVEEYDKDEAYEVDPADLPIHLHEDEGQERDTDRESEQEGEDKIGQPGKLDEFMHDDHGLFFDDWEDIENQQVLNIYSYVLRNTRVLSTEQATDRDSADLYQYKRDKTLPEQMNLARRVMAEEDKYYLTEKGILFRKFQPQPGHKMCHQLVLPSKYRSRIARLFHHGLHGSHRGFHSLLFLVRRRFYWKGLYEDLLSYTNSCTECAATKRDYSHVRTPLHIRKQCRPLEVCHMDVLKVAPTRGGELKVLVMVDRFTKHFEVECIPNEKSEVLAQVLLTSWIHRFGVPKVVVLDRAAAHLSGVFKALAEQFNIKLNYIVGYRPQSNSAVERVHSKILSSLRACLREYPTRPWTSFLSHIRWAHDMSVQTNGFSPYELLFGFECAMSGSLEIEPPALRDGPPQDVLEFMWPDLAFMRTAAARNAREEAENMKVRYDKRHNTKYKGFKPGDLVWLEEVKPRIPAMYKIVPRFRGPYTVVSSPLPGFWLLRIHNEIINQLYPEQRLKRYVGETSCRLRTRQIEIPVRNHAGQGGDRRTVRPDGRRPVRQHDRQTVRPGDGRPVGQHDRPTVRSVDRQSARLADGPATRQTARQPTRRVGELVSGQGSGGSSGQRRDRALRHGDFTKQHATSTRERTKPRKRPHRQADSDGKEHQNSASEHTQEEEPDTLATHKRPCKHTHKHQHTHTHKQARQGAHTPTHIPTRMCKPTGDEAGAQSLVSAPSRESSPECARARIHDSAHIHGASSTMKLPQRIHIHPPADAHTDSPTGSDSNDNEHEQVHTNQLGKNNTSKSIQRTESKQYATKTNKVVYSNPQTRYSLRKRQPETGQVTGRIKRERKDSLSSTSTEESVEKGEKDSRERESDSVDGQAGSDPTSEEEVEGPENSEILPDIPPVRIKRQGGKWKVAKKKRGTHSLRLHHKIHPNPNHRKHNEEEQHMDQVIPQQRHDETDSSLAQSGEDVSNTDTQLHVTLGRDPRGMRKGNTEMLMDGAIRQHVLTTSNTQGKATINKHVGRRDDGIDQLANRRVNSSDLDWTKLRKIVTSKPLKHGKSYLCAWKNRKACWIKGNNVPRRQIDAFERRIRQRKIMHQLNHAHGNMNYIGL